jgi:hypothetical protein
VPLFKLLLMLSASLFNLLVALASTKLVGVRAYAGKRTHFRMSGFCTTSFGKDWALFL